MRGAGGRGRPRRGRVLTAVLALAAGVLAPVAAAPSAVALTGPAGCTADHLPAYPAKGIAWSLAEANGVVHPGGGFQSVSGQARRSFGALTAAQVAAHHRLAQAPAPAGQVLKGARLQFRTSSDPTAGSTDSHTVVPATGARTESAVTYNSRLALSASVLGSITGATGVSTEHSVELTAPALGGALGSAYSLALTSSGTDSPRIWSSEAASAAARPQLVLTFGAE
ncbi:MULTISPECIES: hypothetical protein [Streptomyces]|uniref:hypothetical protein n=1 Tax=Streptomyces TaxID=1883 RepID=UPI001CEF6620|nr:MULTISPECIES: hypothetical protein [Streptomyces]